MRSITFTFRSEVSPDRAPAALAGVSDIPGIARAGLVDANSKNAAVRRVGFALLKEDADAQAVLTAVRALPDVETAAVPPQRRLS